MLIFSTLAVASLTIAAPTAPHPLAKRIAGGVRMCTGENWTGSCWYGIMPLDTCIDLDGL